LPVLQDKESKKQGSKMVEDIYFQEKGYKQAVCYQQHLNSLFELESFLMRKFRGDFATIFVVKPQ